MIKHLKNVAAAEGLPFGDRTRTYNSRLAQEMAKWAETKGRGEEFHLKAFRAYFADGKNIAEKDNLLEMASSVGLNPEEAKWDANTHSAILKSLRSNLKEGA